VSVELKLRYLQRTFNQNKEENLHNSIANCCFYTENKEVIGFQQKENLKSFTGATSRPHIHSDFQSPFW